MLGPSRRTSAHGTNNDTNNCEDSPHPKRYDGDGDPDGWTFRYSDCYEDSVTL